MASLFGLMLGGGLAASGSMEPSPPGHGATRDHWGGEWASRLTSSTRRVTPDIAMHLSTVYASVNLLSKTVAALPVYIQRKDRAGKLYDAPEHPLYSVMQYAPNRWQTAFDFRAMLMMHLMLRGNAYAEIIPGARGAVDQLEPIHPDWVTVDRLADRTLRYTITDLDRRTRVLLQDEMFHIRSPIAPGGLVGIGPVTFARETIGLALAAEEHGARMFGNGIRPSGVLQLPVGKKLSDEAFARLKLDMTANYGGLANVGKTPILEDGTTFQAVSLTADDVQFLATRQFQVEEIARWFDVPPVLLHHTTNSTSWGTGVEAIMLAFVRNNLRPWLSAWEHSIRRDLILVPGVYSVRFDTEDLQRGDSTALANFVQKLVLSSVLTPNEGREMLGYNPMPGGDELLVPVNMTTHANMPDHSVVEPDNTEDTPES